MLHRPHLSHVLCKEHPPSCERRCGSEYWHSSVSVLSLYIPGPAFHFQSVRLRDEHCSVAEGFGFPLAAGMYVHYTVSTCTF